MLVSKLPVDRVSLPGRIIAFALKDKGDLEILVDITVSEQDEQLMARSMVDQMERDGTDMVWRLSAR